MLAGSSDELAQYLEASVSGCTDDDVKCPLHRGSNATITIKFKSSEFGHLGQFCACEAHNTVALSLPLSLVGLGKETDRATVLRVA